MLVSAQSSTLHTLFHIVLVIFFLLFSFISELFTSWIRIRICPCGSGSRRPLIIWIHADPDPKHCHQTDATTFALASVYILLWV